jgi:hypothetical protein
MNNARVLTLLGAIGLIVGAFLPWVSIKSVLGSFFESGIKGYGVFSAGIGVILLLMALLAKGKAGKIYSWVVSILGLLVGILIFSVYNNILHVVVKPAQTLVASIGSGIYLSILGSLLGFIGGLLSILQTLPPATSPLPPTAPPVSPSGPPL